MLEYDFLKAISEYVKIYKGFPLPALICNRSFEVCWSNAPAKNLYPDLTYTDGLLEALGEQDPAALLERLKLDGSCTLSGLLPLSGVNMSLLPIQESFDIVGVIVLLMNADTVPSAGTVLQATKTADALNSSIRGIVDNMFSAMDKASMKADLLRMSWIKSSMNTIGLDGYHILRIVGNVSEYSKFQSGGRNPSFAALNLCELLEALSPTIEETGRAMDIPVAFQLPDAPCILRADSSMLELALFNLLHNSFYFTRPGNLVTVTVAEKDSFALLQVEDRGVGIPASVLPGVCKPYVTCSNDHKGAGIGLGLALIKAVSVVHGGELDIRSVHGEGTCVTLRLPLAGANTSLSLRQADPVRLAGRFSGVYTGLADAEKSPYRE